MYPRRTKNPTRMQALLMGLGIGAAIFIVLGGIGLAGYLLTHGQAPELTATTVAIESETSAINSPQGTLPVSSTLPATSTPSPQPPTLLPETPTPPASPTQFIYTIQSGDTLTSIAEQFDTTVALLKQVNNLTDDNIYAGQTLIIAWEATSTPDGNPVNTPAPSGTSQPLPSTSPPPIAAATQYIVQPGDTLEQVAAAFSLPLENIRLANYMVGDALLSGQRLLVPLDGVTPAPTSYAFSILEGDLAASYPLVFETDRFTLHYTPDTYPAENPDILAGLVSNGLSNDEAIFQVTLPWQFDVYVAGSVFAAPDRPLRGRSFSSVLRYHFLHDGTGNASDQQYIAAHELTHLFMWNVFGIPANSLISEGSAVYAGMTLIASSDHLPLETFCAVYLQAGALPYVSTSLSFNGHNIDLDNYYAAGCFAGYLIQTYGPAVYGLLYPSGDFDGTYGQPLSSLEDDWRAYLTSLPVPDWLDPTAFVVQVEAVTTAYASFFPSFSGTPTQLQAYRELDLARLAILDGDIAASSQHMASYNSILNP